MPRAHLAKSVVIAGGYSWKCVAHGVYFKISCLLIWCKLIIVPHPDAVVEESVVEEMICHHQNQAN